MKKPDAEELFEDKTYSEQERAIWANLEVTRKLASVARKRCADVQLNLYSRCRASTDPAVRAAITELDTLLRAADVLDGKP